MNKRIITHKVHLIIPSFTCMAYSCFRPQSDLIDINGTARQETSRLHARMAMACHALHGDNEMLTADSKKTNMDSMSMYSLSKHFLCSQSGTPYNRGRDPWPNRALHALCIPQHPHHLYTLHLTLKHSSVRSSSSFTKTCNATKTICEQHDHCI